LSAESHFEHVLLSCNRMFKKQKEKQLNLKLGLCQLGLRLHGSN